MRCGNPLRRLGIERPHAFGIGFVTAQLFGQRLRQLLKIYELSVTVDLRVAREDLLDQGCAGTWQADDKNGPLGLATDPALLGKQLPAKSCNHPVDIGRFRLGPKRILRSIQIISSLETPERGIVIAIFVVQLGESEM